MPCKLEMPQACWLSPIVITPSVVAFQEYITESNVENSGHGDFQGSLP
jgi:hypothetical protein